MMSGSNENSEGNKSMNRINEKVKEATKQRRQSRAEKEHFIKGGGTGGVDGRDRG